MWTLGQEALEQNLSQTLKGNHTIPPERDRDKKRKVEILNWDQWAMTSKHTNSENFLENVNVVSKLYAKEILLILLGAAILTLS